jgi:hypothetical protein
MVYVDSSGITGWMKFVGQTAIRAIRYPCRYVNTFFCEVYYYLFSVHTREYINKNRLLCPSPDTV